MPHSNAPKYFPRLAAAVAGSAMVLSGCLSVAGVAFADNPTGSGQVLTPSPQPQPSPTPAATQPGANPTTQVSSPLTNPLKYNNLTDLLSAILKALIELGSVILTLALVWVGFQFVAARGNEEAIRKARTSLMYTVIGGLILLGATAIQLVITSTVTSLTS